MSDAVDTVRSRVAEIRDRLPALPDTHAGWVRFDGDERAMTVFAYHRPRDASQQGEGEMLRAAFLPGAGVVRLRRTVHDKYADRIEGTTVTIDEIEPAEAADIHATALEWMKDTEAEDDL